MSILYLRDPFHDNELAALDFVNKAHASLTASAPLPVSGPIAEGPGFRFESAPSLFQGRRGFGSLRIAWDTNLLIHFFDHGRDLIEGRPLPDSADPDLVEELEALQWILALSVLRDIRFYLFERVITDARKTLSSTNRKNRLRAFNHFVAALAHGIDEDEVIHDARLALPRSVLDTALKCVPTGADRELVVQAHRERLHVFMTRDRGILRCAENLRPLGLLMSKPTGVLDELAACGALHCMLAPEYLYWPLPDLARMAHVIEALPTSHDTGIEE